MVSKDPGKPLNVLFVASEYEGLVKTGGLADVAKALPAALKQAGVNVKVLIPYYRALHHLAPEKVLNSLSVPLNQTDAYGCSLRYLEDDGVDVYLLERNDLYDRDGLYDNGHWPYDDNPRRFGLLTKAAFSVAKALDFQPDIIHSHDWQTALAGYYRHVHLARDPYFKKTRVVFNVHNGAYQGRSEAGWMDVLGIDTRHFTPELFEDHGDINLLKGGVAFSDAVVPVSPGYAEELLQERTSHGLWQTFQAHQQKVRGIINGCDYGQWDPSIDTALPARYDADDLAGKATCKSTLQAALGLAQSPETPLFGLVSRLTDQKGFHYLIPALHGFLQNDVQLAMLGSGDPHFAQQLSHLAATYPGQVHFTEGYSDTLAHRIEAASDFFIMPSLFEPCGLNQIYSMRYGTLPIVRRTGGLKDTVVPLNARLSNVRKATGIGFETASIDATEAALLQAHKLYRDHPEHYRTLQQTAMTQRFTWDKPAAEYQALYRSVAQ